VKGKFVHLSYVVAGKGIRLATAKVVLGKSGPKPKQVVYGQDKFLLYVAGRRDELRIRIPTTSKRRLRRFLRNYVCSVGGSPWSTNYWFTPWR